MMLDVKRLKTINHILTSGNFDLYELIFYSNHHVYLIIRDERILYKYNSLIWAERRFEKLTFDIEPDWFQL